MGRQCCVLPTHSCLSTLSFLCTIFLDYFVYAYDALQKHSSSLSFFCPLPLEVPFYFHVLLFLILFLSFKQGCLTWARCGCGAIRWSMGNSLAAPSTEGHDSPFSVCYWSLNSSLAMSRILWPTSLSWPQRVFPSPPLHHSALTFFPPLLLPCLLSRCLVWGLAFNGYSFSTTWVAMDILPHWCLLQKETSLMKAESRVCNVLNINI